MKTYKTSLGKAWNILKNENKFKYGCRVKIIKNDGFKKDDEFVGKIGIYEGIEYINKEAPFRVHFYGKGVYCFSYNELERVD